MTMNVERIVHSSETLYNGMPNWQTSHEPVKKLAKDIFNVTVVNEMRMHIAAHFDAPTRVREDRGEVRD